MNKTSNKTQIALDKMTNLVYNTDMTNNNTNTNKNSFSKGTQNMIVTKIGSKSQAKLEVFKIDRRIEKKIEQHVNELGKHNTDIVERELEGLWAKKSILVSYINS